MNKYCVVGHAVTLDENDIVMSVHYNFMIDEYPSELLLKSIFDEMQKVLEGTVVDCYISVVDVVTGEANVLYNHLIPKVNVITN